MKDKEPDVIDLGNRFRRLGMRFTPQREAVWKLFRDSQRGYSIPEAIEVLKDQGIGMATVYRTVMALQEIGRLQLGARSNRRPPLRGLQIHARTSSGLREVRKRSGISRPVIFPSWKGSSL